MKKVIVACVAMVLASSAVASEGWLTDFEQAKKLAAEKGRPILVDFSGSDWCGWCIRLDKEVFSQKAFKQYAEKNVIRFLADFPSETELPKKVAAQNKKLAEQYGVAGFPTVLLLDAEGKVLARTGYRRGGAEAYVEHLKEWVAKTHDKKVEVSKE